MKVLIACEYSGIVRNAFIKAGHDAISCDILPTEIPGNHIQENVLNILKNGWDMMIGHPPCTYLSVSGNRWMKNNPERELKRNEAADFFMKLYNADIEKIAIENPVGIMSTRFRKPDQYIQPYEYGYPETKKTGLWLRGLPKLEPTNIVEPIYIIGKDGKKYSPVHYFSQWKDKTERWKIRSKTYTGISEAMAKQWG